MSVCGKHGDGKKEKEKKRKEKRKKKENNKPACFGFNERA